MPTRLRKLNAKVRPVPPRVTTPSAAERPRPASAKKAKTYRLSEAKIAAAQAILGVPTATAAIETALDMIVFRRELVEGTAAMLGVPIAPYDAE